MLTQTRSRAVFLIWRKPQEYGRSHNAVAGWSRCLWLLTDAECRLSKNSQGLLYLPLLSRSEHIVYFFRDVQGIYPAASAAYGASEPARRVLHHSEHGDGRTFCSLPPKYPTEDPEYRIMRSRRSRHLHDYFYIRDPVLGPLAMCFNTYLPFHAPPT